MKTKSNTQLFGNPQHHSAGKPFTMNTSTSRLLQAMARVKTFAVVKSISSRLSLICVSLCLFSRQQLSRLARLYIPSREPQSTEASQTISDNSIVRRRPSQTPIVIQGQRQNMLPIGRHYRTTAFSRHLAPLIFSS